MRYEGRVYRPPAEADSLLVQMTIGCSHNRCAFCAMYSGLRFRVRPLLEVLEDIDGLAARYPYARRAFLCDGDPLAAGFESVFAVCRKLNNSFPRLRRIGAYTNARDVLAMELSHLRALREQNLSLFYLGLESGDPETLKNIHKGATPDEMIKAVHHAKAAGIKTSVIALVGIGGRERTKEHAAATADVLNRMQPPLLSFLTTIIIEGTSLHHQIEQGRFTPLTDRECLQELHDTIARLELGHCVLRANHTSNLVALEGRLPKDKSRLLEELDMGFESVSDEITCVWAREMGMFL